MTEENMEVQVEDANAPVLEAAEENVSAEANDIIKAETVFFIVKNTDGSFKAITNVAQKIELARPATIQDIRTGCREIYEAVDTRYMAEMVAGLVLRSTSKTEA